MAGGGGGLQLPQRQKRGKTSKRKKPHRMGFTVDMTPLVDITMLLLTFFMFTTTMLKPQIMEMKIPPESTTDGSNEVKVKGSELFFLLIREDGKIFYQEGKADGKMTDPVVADVKKLQEISVKQNLKPSIEKNHLITVLKVDPKAKYEVVIKVLNELNNAEASITAEIKKSTDPSTGKPMERKRKFTFGTFGEEETKLVGGL